MKTLESIKVFKAKKLNKAFMTSVTGGATNDTPTGAGSICTVSTATGCMGFKRDTIFSNGNVGYYETWEINAPCDTQ